MKKVAATTAVKFLATKEMGFRMLPSNPKHQGGSDCFECPTWCPHTAPLEDVRSPSSSSARPLVTGRDWLLWSCWWFPVKCWEARPLAPCLLLFQNIAFFPSSRWQGESEWALLILYYLCLTSVCLFKDPPPLDSASLRTGGIHFCAGLPDDSDQAPRFDFLIPSHRPLQALRYTFAINHLF